MRGIADADRVCRLQGGNGLNFYLRTKGQLADLYARTRRAGSRKVLFVHFINSGKVAHVGNKNSGLDHIGGGEPLRFKQGHNIFAGLLGLGRYIALNQLANGRINGTGI